MSVVGFIWGLGLAEVSIILVIVLVVFGAGRLPSVLGALGSGLRTLREAASGARKEEKVLSERSRPTADS